MIEQSDFLLQFGNMLLRCTYGKIVKKDVDEFSFKKSVIVPVFGRVLAAINGNNTVVSICIVLRGRWGLDPWI